MCRVFASCLQCECRGFSKYGSREHKTLAYQGPPALALAPYWCEQYCELFVPETGVSEYLKSHMAEDLPTLSEIFLNASVPALPLAGAFGVCYVAFAGAHDIRYRGEKLLEVAARQVTAAAAARGSTIAQCVATDQPERKRPYVQLSVPLRTSLDVTPFAAKCEEYTRRFKRPCKLLFGYMAKAIAVARPPYSTTLFVDTDTFVCDATPLLAFPRLMKSFDVLLLLPRTRISLPHPHH